MTTLSIVLLTAAMSLALILLLTGVLLFAKKRLTPEGTVTITINRDTTIQAAQGASLLATLAQHQIYLPSACGGGGTCGLCRCRVLEGGGAILPTETGFFTRRQQQAQWRLGCQVKVRQDMHIEIPQSVLGIRKWECTVVSNHNVATFIKELVIDLPAGEHLDFQSGGYIQIDIPPITVAFKDMDIDAAYLPAWDSMGLRALTMVNKEPACRAYSMANHPAEGNRIRLNVRIATPPWDRAAGAFARVNPGISSSYIFSLKAGDTLTLSGPYGEFFLKDTTAEKMFIGGGAGMAPMRSHIFHLFKTLAHKEKVTFWYGARSLQELFYQDEFEAIAREFPNFSFHIALSEPRPEDHWDGPVGFIHQVIYNQYLQHHATPEDVEYYLCGPPLMTSAVIDMLDNLGVPKDNILYDDFGG